MIQKILQMVFIFSWTATKAKHKTWCWYNSVTFKCCAIVPRGSSF